MEKYSILEKQLLYRALLKLKYEYMEINQITVFAQSNAVFGSGSCSSIAKLDLYSKSSNSLKTLKKNDKMEEKLHGAGGKNKNLYSRIC